MRAIGPSICGESDGAIGVCKGVSVFQECVESGAKFEESDEERKGGTMLSGSFDDSDIQVGKSYRARVKSVHKWGVFCELLGTGKEGLVHISELDDAPIKNVEDVVKLGDEFRVKVLEVDKQGRINLSRNAPSNE